MICYDGYTIDHWDLRDKNSSRTYTTGSRWCNKDGEWATIVGQLTKYNLCKKGYRHHDFYLLLFDDGHYAPTRIETIYRRNIVNPYTPVVCGRGFPGQGPWKYAKQEGVSNKLYYIWCQMLQRCYSETERAKTIQHSYKDCEVDERWWNFQNFCEDLSHMEHFEDYLKIDRRYELDKDTLFEGNRIYSKDTCQIILKVDNIAEMTDRCKGNYLTGLTYIGTNKKLNLEVEFTNQREFCRGYNLMQSNVWRCINGCYGCRSTKGWAFKVKEGTDGVS